MPEVRLGNVAVREVIGADHDGAPIHRRHSGQSTTVIHLPSDEENWTHDERVRTVVHDDGHWRAHSSKPPAWVESDDPQLQAELAAHFGCPIGRPSGWTDQITEV
jgi:hypothetical protein